MSFVSNLLNAVATPTGAPIPPHELIRARLEDARSAIPPLEGRWREANLDHELSGTEQTASNLALAKRDLEDAKGRVSDLTEALGTAEERALVSQDAEARRQHAAKLRALEAHATTLRRAAKNFAARLEQSEAAWDALLSAVSVVARAVPNGSYGQNESSPDGGPLGHMLGLGELQTAVVREVSRLVAAKHPEQWAQIGNRSFFLGVRPTGDNFHKEGSAALPSFEQRMAEAMANIMHRARQAPVAPLAPAPVPVNEVPALPNKVKPDDIPDLERLKQLHAADMAELTAAAPPAWDATDIEAQKAEWQALHAAEPEAEGEDLTAALAAWKALNPHGEDADALAEMQAQPKEGAE